jgi:hypothetical protein
MGETEGGLLEITKKAHLLVPLVQGWLEASSRYLRAERDDPPYLYNERVDVSLLAAGAWIKGFVALEEYMSMKGENRGRPDIYIIIKGKGISIEAKRKWLRATLRHTPSKSFSSTMRSAICDVRKVSEGNVHFGIGFFPLSFSQKNYLDFRSNSSTYITNEIEKYSKSPEADLLSWYFPKAQRACAPQADSGRKNSSSKSYYPGIILAIKKL